MSGPWHGGRAHKFRHATKLLLETLFDVLDKVCKVHPLGVSECLSSVMQMPSSGMGDKTRSRAI